MTGGFIQLFSCSTGCYLYDVNTDSILKIGEDTYHNLKSKQNLDNDPQIQRLKHAGYLKDSRVQVTEHPATQTLEYFYENELSSVTLQVTQRCNLRCEYCVYSGKYNTRVHSDRNMDFEMAKKGIDYLLTHSKESQELRFGFYGGEPLLAFDLIKSCVEYIESCVKDKKIVYLVTTNATLLTPAIVGFMVLHKFDITVSFDGPKEIHDKYRKFADGNRGSYDLVIQNVKYIREKYFDYFKEHLSFNTVLNPKEGYERIAEYLNKEELFREVPLTSGLVSDAGIKEEEKNDLSQEFTVEFRYEYFKLMLAKMGRLKAGGTSLLVKDQFENVNLLRGGKHQRSESELPQKWHHGGPCIPGERSIFLNVDGNFYPCERVCECSEEAVMGNIDEGIVFDKVLRILNVEKNTEKECRECWAYRYCNICIRYAEHEEEKLRKNILKRCGKMRRTVEDFFKDYCVMRELGYDFEVECTKEQRDE